MVSDDAASAPAAKRVLRQAARTRRAQRSPAERGAHARALAEVRHDALDGATSVAAFVGVGDEPDTGLLLGALRSRGVRVLLPVVLPDLDLDWAEYGGPGSLAEAGYGLLEPTGPRLGLGAVGSVDVVLVPAFAVDAEGRRLGQGGGCYDRALTRVPDDVPVLAVLFPDDLSEQPLPDEPHDRRVDGVLIPPG